MTLGILAGGRGKRLGGRDKGLLIQRGQPLVAQLASSALQVHEVIVNCHANAWLYLHYACRLVCDPHPEGGPAKGMETLVMACQSPLLAILPCDQASPPWDWITSLWRELGDAPGVFVVRNDRHSPCCLLRPSLLIQTITTIKQKDLALDDWYRRLGIKGVLYPTWPRDVNQWCDMTDR